MNRCESISPMFEKRCRLGAGHKQLHKSWNHQGVTEWADRPLAEHPIIRYWRWFWGMHPYDKIIVGAIALVIVAACFPNPFRSLNPDNWNTSDQETGFSCSVPMPTAMQETREYASCVHTAMADVEGWH